MKTLILLITLLICNCLLKAQNNLPFKAEVINCSPDIQSKALQAGVVITLDDTFIDDWTRADSILAKTNWKVTFCVSSFSTLNDNQKRKLLKLQEKGHEIAFHGVHHTNSTTYLLQHSLKEYIDYEYGDVVDVMRGTGLHIYSFAYPFGARNAITDSLLLNGFSVLRTISSKGLPPEKQNCYFNNSPLISAIGIEPNYAYFNHEYLTQLLKYAQDNHKILVVYGHRPVPEPSKLKHEVGYATLQLITDYINNNNMRFYTMKDLKCLLNP
ncbi:MAG: polysaccharide deacetylase family protein [Mucilaginibacter sp.]